MTEHDAFRGARLILAAEEAKIEQIIGDLLREGLLRLNADGEIELTPEGLAYRKALTSTQGDLFGCGRIASRGRC